MADAGITTGFNDPAFRLTTTGGGDQAADPLARAATGLRRRRGVPVDKWFQLVGGALVVLGLLAIVVGWYGVSHTARTWRQTPYVVSGGLLGLGLIFAGGFSYYSYWQTKLLEEARIQSRYLAGIDQLLRAQAAGSVGATGLVVADGGIVHRVDCPVVAGRADVRPVRGDEAGLRPCPMCEPSLPA